MTVILSEAKDLCAFCGRKFPVGKRIAFDPARTRLWDICAKCGQWNLTALDLDERRAAIGKLEQTFAATTSRSGSADVGIAKLPDGTSLVRVGNGNWSQFAAWRYGRRFRHRQFGYVAFVVANMVFTPMLDRQLFATTFSSALTIVCGAALLYWALIHRRLSSVPLQDGRRASIFARHELAPSIMLRDGTWQLFVRHDRGESLLAGPEALRILGVLLARRNYNGASKEDVAMAIDMIQRAGGAERVFSAWLRPGLLGMKEGSNKLRKLPKPLALALEMAAHEETERRALQGELAVLKLDVSMAAERAKIVEEIA